MMSLFRVSVASALAAAICARAASAAFPVGGGSLPPWAKDAAITDVYVADARYFGFPSPGSVVTSWTPAKGSNSPNAFVNCQFGANYDSKGRSYIGINLATTSYVKIDSLAASVIGTAHPFTLTIAAQLPVAPPGPPIGSSIWYLLIVANSHNAAPAIGIAGSAGSTAFGISRRNDSATQFNSSVFSPGTAPFVFTARYDGSTMTTVFNNALVDNAIPFGGGSMSGLDTLSIGFGAIGGTGGYSSPNLRGFVFVASALSSTEYMAVHRYFL